MRLRLLSLLCLPALALLTGCPASGPDGVDPALDASDLEDIVRGERASRALGSLLQVAGDALTELTIRGEESGVFGDCPEVAVGLTGGSAAATITFTDIPGQDGCTPAGSDLTVSGQVLVTFNELADGIDAVVTLRELVVEGLLLDGVIDASLTLDGPGGLAVDTLLGELTFTNLVVDDGQVELRVSGTASVTVRLSSNPQDPIASVEIDTADLVVRPAESGSNSSGTDVILESVTYLPGNTALPSFGQLFVRDAGLGDLFTVTLSSTTALTGQATVTAQRTGEGAFQDSVDFD